jgi:lactoylglutathione lyase
VTFAVADQEQMPKFLVDKLGFEKTTDAEMAPGQRWLEVKPAAAQTAIALTKAADFKRVPDTEFPGTLSCTNLEGTVAALRPAGLTVADPVIEPWGSYLHVTDPEGHTILINETGEEN